MNTENEYNYAIEVIDGMIDQVIVQMQLQSLAALDGNKNKVTTYDMRTLRGTLKMLRCNRKEEMLKRKQVLKK